MRNNIYHQAVEVYLQQHNGMDFKQFQLTYLLSTDGSRPIGISIWDCPNIIHHTCAQLSKTKVNALVAYAKQRLARLEKCNHQHKRNEKQENLPPAVYGQQGSLHTATSTWSKVPMQENSETAQTSIETVQ